ncbi:putative large polymerase protein [Alphahymrhavirus distinguendus]|uniref:Replicase n=1 Tax=Lariophagus distinguendus negative-strand RNA virus 1 TaxID=2848911 RepID=A0A8F2J187_9VIRU|nr:putative large polymerase protein [Lariophagus distinguendus negative-strand RNA virus 1]
MFDDNFSFDDDAEEYEGQRGPLATHCNVPLKYSAARAALGVPALGQHVSPNNRYRREWEEIQKLSGSSKVDFIDGARHQFRMLNSLVIPDRGLCNIEFNQQWQVGSRLWDLNIQALKKVDPSLSLPQTIDVQDQVKDLLRVSYKIKCFYEEAVMSSGSESFIPELWWTKRGSVTFVKMNSIKIFVTSNLCYVMSAEGTALLSRDHLLIWSDLAAQRYALRLLSVLESAMNETPYLTWDELNFYFDNGDRMLYYGGNEAYKVIYGSEPELISKLVGNIPVGTANGAPFHAMVRRDLTEAAEACGIMDLYEERRQFINERAHFPAVISQLHGLYRIWGHPTVEPLGGASALKQITRTVRMLHPEKAYQIDLKFKEEFITRYIAKNNRWPELDCSQLNPYNIIRTSYESQGAYPIRHQDYKRSHLRLVKFKKTFPVDPKFDLTEMLADKAISLDTDCLLHRLRNGQGVGTSQERSVLLKWLESDLHDPATFLQTINVEGFPANERSLGVKEKEREGKKNARLFGLMTLVKRMYIVLTEALLAEHLIPFFPEITMTDSELMLDKKRLQFAGKSKECKKLFTSLDFSKWNSNMRKEETDPIFSDFDHLFGFSNVFSRTHEMFNKSDIYLLNGSYLPRPQGDGLMHDIGCWNGHLGGIEGLRQKGWTIWTVILILLCAEDLPVQIALMGQGDNQILRESYSVEIDTARMMEIHFQFLGRLNDMLEHVGPPLKMEETWTSEHLFVYGKYMIHKGASLPTYGKRICRMFRLSNEDYPTLESTLSSLSANLSSAMACSWDPGVLYFIYCMEAVGSIQLFLRGSFLQPKPPLQVLRSSSTLEVPGETRPKHITVPPLVGRTSLPDNSFYIGVLLLPRILGGFPITNLLQSLLRGFPDEVNLSVSILSIFHGFASDKEKRIIERILQPEFATTVQYEMLYEHPTALNLELPPAPSESRRKMVIEFLKDTPRIKNPAFKEFINLLDHPAEKAIIDYLQYARPFNPRFLGLIAGATIDARARQLAGRLQKTKTISELARTEGRQNIYSKIASSELNHVLSVVRRLTVPATSPVVWYPNKCSMTHTMELRNTGWRVDIVGVDCVSPFEFMEIEPVVEENPCPPGLELDKGYIVISQSIHLSEPDLQNALIVGSHFPYRGSATSRKTSGFGDSLSEVSDPLLTKLLGLFSLLGWATPPDGNLARVIKAMLAARTDIDPNLLLPDFDQLAGSIHHRLQDERSGHGGSVAVLPNFGSKFFFNTFPLSAYSKGSKNVNLMFQSVMSVATVLRGWGLRRGIHCKTPTFHIHVKRSCCVRDIVEDPVDCDTPPGFLIPSRPDNPYLYIKSSSMKEVVEQLISFPKTVTPSRRPDDCSRRLVPLLAHEIVKTLKVGMWTSLNRGFSNHGLLINWALRCPLQQLLEHVTFLIGCYVFPAVRGDRPEDFLLRLSEFIVKSPLPEWTQMSNLLFCPNFHHELVKEPYLFTISGNPRLSLNVLATNLRGVCSRIASTWASNPSSKDRIGFLDIFSPPSCGASLHPSLQLLFRDYLLNKNSSDVLLLRNTILNTLLLKDSQDVFSVYATRAKNYVSAGRLLICADSVDTLCKFAKEIDDEAQVMPGMNKLLDPSASVLIRVSRSRLSPAEIRLLPTTPSNSRSYIIHAKKPLAAPTSGSYKGLSLLRHIHPFLPDTVLCLGDGAGGFTWSALRTYSSSEVTYNSLIDSSEAIQQAAPVPYLPALAGWPSFEARLKGMTTVNEGISDILHPGFETSLRRYGTVRADLIMGDMESPNYLKGIDPVIMTMKVGSICRSMKTQILIKKDYALNPRALRASVSILLAYFNEVSVVKSWFSSGSNTEVYLICSQPISGKVPRLKGDMVTGELLPLDFEQEIVDIMRDIRDGASPLTAEIVLSYTEAIDPNFKESLVSQLIQGLPMVLKTVPLLFPHAVTSWIGSTSMKNPGRPTAIRRSMESSHFSIPYLQRWSLAYLVLWCSISNKNHEQLDSLWQSLKIVWFRTQNLSWGLSLTGNDIPENESVHRKVWNLPQILGSRHQKIIHRLTGIMTMLDIEVVSFSEAIEVGGQAADGRPLSSPFLAVDPWCREFLQFTGVSKVKILPLRIRETVSALLRKSKTSRRPKQS